MSSADLNPEIDEKTIAVIGMAGRFPGAPTIDQFWQNLCAGREAISFFSVDELRAAGVDPALLENPDYVRAAALLDDVDRFDAAFFGITPGDAALMDPQQRLFLECAWEALEHAGYTAETYSGLIGLYAGTAWDTYLLKNLVHSPQASGVGSDYQVFVANDKDFMPTRVSYKLNLKGPSLIVQTACSTSLVATHLACLSLFNYECDLALAGGVCVLVPQKVGYLYQVGGIDSPDGHCRAFDARAQGTVFGSGVGIVALKRLADAIADGDTIHALIRGSAINNDGALKVSYTAPSVEGQAEVVAAAQAVADVDPESISYIEAHGTGTAIGDPIEVAALTKVFRRRTTKQGFCAIGSVKSNIGHLSVAAGVAGLIKTILALKHKQIPPSLHFEQANAAIDFASSPFFVNTALAAWEPQALPRRAGVSSFGVGGTNAHIILEEAPALDSEPACRRTHLLLLSAKSSAALDSATANLVEHLDQHPEVDLADVAYTLQVGRAVFPYRRALICGTRADAAEALRRRDPQRLLTGTQPQELSQRPVAFLFSGQGSQYVQMGRGLYETEPLFREQIDRCAELLRPELGLDLREVLYPAELRMEDGGWRMEDRESAILHPPSSILDQTQYAQPALFAIEYALAQLLIAWGITPAAMLGHSLGEYVAATLAGVFTLEDALALVAARGRLIQELPPGAMLAVPVPENELLPLLPPQLALAAANTPTLSVVAGPLDAIEAFGRSLADRGLEGRRLHVSHAFHSPMIEAAVEPFVALVRQVHLNPPAIPYVSNLSGTWIAAEEATDAAYWGRHLRETVRFGDGVALLAQTPRLALLEVGPDQTLSRLASQHPARKVEQPVLHTLRPAREQSDDQVVLQHALGMLWLAGVPIDWRQLYANERRLRVPLPTYPFERQRYWIAPSQPSSAPQVPVEATLKKRADIADWFYLPVWRRSVQLSANGLGVLEARQRWLVFVDQHGIGSGIARRLRERGQQVVAVLEGDAFGKNPDGAYTLVRGRREDYDALFDDLERSGGFPSQIVHCWSITAAPAEMPQAEQLEQAVERSFYSLIFLAQALGERQLDGEVQISVLSNAMQRIAAEPLLMPEKALLLGPCKVIPQEYPQLTCRSIDVDLPPRGTRREQQLIDLLIAELDRSTAEPAIAYRGTDRWTLTYEPVRQEGADRPPALRQQGVYLITGGLGAIGRVLAADLARTCQARLVLIGRSGLPGREGWTDWLASHAQDDPTSTRIRAVQELEAAGAEVLTISADITDAGQVQYAVDLARRRFGTIHGVIHAAGLAGGGMIQLKTLAGAASVLAPKVCGTIALAAALEDVPLDFMVLCSSLAAVTGGFGQVDYCAANAFLDAFAAFNTLRCGTPTLAINWDAWQEVGMAVRNPGRSDRQPAANGREPKAAVAMRLGKRVSSADGEASYRTAFDALRDWRLLEHRIDGIPVLPGTAYLDLAQAAWSDYQQTDQMELHDIRFLAPLIVRETEPQDVDIILRSNGASLDLRIISRPAGATAGHGEQTHVTGKASAAAPLVPRHHALADLIARCSRDTIIVAPGQQRMTGEHMVWGPRWHSLRTIHLGETEAIARLELPEEYMPDLQAFRLHPALVDVATTFALPWVGRGDYLPVGYKRFQVHGALPGKIYSYARYHTDGQQQPALLNCDITLMDEDGHELVAIEGFTMRRIDPEQADMLQRQTALLDAGASAQASLADWRADAIGVGGGILPQEGIAVFRRLLAHPLQGQVVVSTHDLPAVLERIRSLTPGRIMEAMDQARSGTGAGMDRPEGYAAAANTAEQTLAAIWQAVLGIETVGIHDNFFELGGDSLLGLQIVTRARQAGLPLTSQQLFQHQTIAGLSAAVEAAAPPQAETGSGTARQPDQKPEAEPAALESTVVQPAVTPAQQDIIVGPIGLTIDQGWFLNQEQIDPRHRYHLVSVLHTRPQLVAQLLEQAVGQLVRHHDALRSRFVRDGGAWLARIAPPAYPPPFAAVDLTAVADADLPGAIAQVSDTFQRRFDVAEGPLVQVVYADCGPERPGRLLLIVHHLVADGYSLLILLEDLHSAYQQLARGAAVQLPPKTTSIQAWTERLHSYVRSAELQAELAYWYQLPWGAVPRVPRDFLDIPTGITNASLRTAEGSLGVEETQALLRTLAQADQAQMADALVLALVDTITQRTQGQWAEIVMIDTGRTIKPVSSDLDLSRTVGWLAASKLLVLERPVADCPVAALRAMVARLRSIPGGGFGYHMLRFLSPDSEVVRRLASLRKNDVIFNYFGRVQYTLPDDSIFSGFAEEQSGLSVNPDDQVFNGLKINAMLMHNQLHMSWLYSTAAYRRETIEQLMDHFLGVLRGLVEAMKEPNYA